MHAADPGDRRLVDAIFKTARDLQRVGGREKNARERVVDMVQRRDVRHTLVPDRHQ